MSARPLGGGAITPRVAEALDHLVRGATRQQAAEAMGVSSHTIKNFWQIAYQQLGCTNRTSAALVWSQMRHPAAMGLVCARCSDALGEDRLLAGGWFE
jgi:DNA-binding NarL/FixJ family response regulator